MVHYCGHTTCPECEEQIPVREEDQHISEHTAWNSVGYPVSCPGTNQPAQSE
jgi:hypothetical protein